MRGRRGCRGRWLALVLGWTGGHGRRRCASSVRRIGYACAHGTHATPAWLGFAWPVRLRPRPPRRPCVAPVSPGRYTCAHGLRRGPARPAGLVGPTGRPPQRGRRAWSGRASSTGSITSRMRRLARGRERGPLDVREWGPSEYESEGPHPAAPHGGRRLPGFLAVCDRPPGVEAATEIPVTRLSAARVSPASREFPPGRASALAVNEFVLWPGELAQEFCADDFKIFMSYP